MRLLILLLINICSAIYDKLTNRDLTSQLVLRTTEIPFYSSANLYSNHYSKIMPIHKNITKK